ncbi:MAG: flagellar motor protein [Gammaproteobacteria bacterium]|jgi:chemotaxis protein MotA
MDVLSLLGLLFAVASIVAGLLIEGGAFESLFNGAALLIVLGGTFGAVMVQSQISMFLYSLRLMAWVFFPPRLPGQQDIRRIIEWSNIARKEGLLGLENIAEDESDIFARKGLQLLVDGNEPAVIKRVMQVEIDSRQQYNHHAACVVESLGRHSLVVGLIAAAIGLMQISADPSDLHIMGASLETALVALIYGFGFTQFVFVPFAAKLKYLVAAQARGQSMLLEGLLSIAEGENPRNIETKLQGFVNSAGSR